MLSERERVVFDLLGVLTASFAVESVVSIVGDRMGAWDVLDALTGLVTKSMAIADVSIAGSRYSMLETLRAYAVEHLRAAGTLDAERRAHRCRVRRHRPRPPAQCICEFPVPVRRCGSGRCTTPGVGF